MDILLAELDGMHLVDDCDSTHENSSRNSESSSDEELKLCDERFPEKRKLVRSVSCGENESPDKINTPVRRWSLRSSRSDSPVLKKNAVSWAYEGHSAF